MVCAAAAAHCQTGKNQQEKAFLFFSFVFVSTNCCNYRRQITAAVTALKLKEQKQKQKHLKTAHEGKEEENEKKKRKKSSVWTIRNDPLKILSLNVVVWENSSTIEPIITLLLLLLLLLLLPEPIMTCAV